MPNAADSRETAARPQGSERPLQTFRLGETVEPVTGLGLDDIPGAVVKANRHDEAVWLHLVEPDEETIEQARETLGIHRIAAADVASGRQQPKVQMFEEHLFVMLWSILHNPKTDELELGQTYLYIGDGWLLTVQRGKGMRDLRRLLEEAPDYLGEGAMGAAYTIMADVVDGYAKAAADIEGALEELEEQVFSESTDEDHRRIYQVRKDIGRVDRAVSSIAAALRESTKHLESTKLGTERIVPHLHDLLDDAAGTAALINDQSRALDAILSSHENNIAARQNKDMRTISAFAALLALPTLIAGFYGMNFKTLPMTDWSLGWLVVAGIIAVIDITIYILFKRRRWL